MISATTHLYLSPADLAETLGLSVSTLKRWTDKGILTVERTAGGHRRIAVAEALRFVRDSGLKPVMPHRLGLGDPKSTASARVPRDHLSELLLDGQSDAARRFLVSSFAAGEDIAKIGDEWIRPAFEALGERWKHGEEGIALEHQATDAVLRAIAEMRALVHAPEEAKTAIVGAISGDPYQIPSALVGLLVCVQGFQCTNFGANLPIDALLAMAQRTKPRLVCISVSVPGLEEGTKASLETLTARLNSLGSAVAIGGHAAPERVKNATICRDLTSLAAFARGLLA